jgi:hypothetical protein
VPLTKSRGILHDYLGMSIDFLSPKSVRFTMRDYLEGMLDELPPLINREAPTPASALLFNLDDEATMLNKSDAEFFHHNVAKILFLCKQGQPDSQTAVTILCTRVTCLDVDDWKELYRVPYAMQGRLDR